ncbi:hypothetical protein EWM64_g5833 [Hericium alpestre]|uniref:WIBG Mago-binding domain-containing protein n=1 Tax=Hericium alpestre TaxID=135208 RepID=A0A4Y9ZXH2_9AGAM|nr:hypothetical protein EWM64_g5833 [Hericium alpestre]
MSRPSLNPPKTTAGIALDPRTLERVIPESRRPDGSIRKQIKIRPGYTPQEDVQRFRGTRQQATETGKGQVVGWIAPSSKKDEVSKPLSKSAKKNEKRKEKRKEKREEPVRESWDSDEEDGKEEAAQKDGKAEKENGHPSEAPPSTTTSDESKTPQDSNADAIADKLEKLSVS